MTEFKALFPFKSQMKNIEIRRLLKQVTEDFKNLGLTLTSVSLSAITDEEKEAAA